MDTVLLPAEKRDAGVKCKVQRAERKLPGVVYGHGFDSMALLFDYENVRKAYIKAGETTIVDLDVDGKKIPVLFKDIQFHPVTDKIQHVDFYKVNLKEKITAHVPVVFVGTSIAVKDLGGTLTHQVTEIDVKCLPTEIPHEFEVDISSLVDFHGAIHVGDLVVPDGVEILSDPEATIATVSAPRVEAEPEEELSPEEAEKAAIAEQEGEGDAEGGESEEGGE